MGLTAELPSFKPRVVVVPLGAFDEPPNPTPYLVESGIVLSWSTSDNRFTGPANPLLDSWLRRRSGVGPRSWVVNLFQLGELHPSLNTIIRYCNHNQVRVPQAVLRLYSAEFQLRLLLKKGPVEESVASASVEWARLFNSLEVGTHEAPGL